MQGFPVVAFQSVHTFMCNVHGNVHTFVCAGNLTPTRQRLDTPLYKPNRGGEYEGGGLNPEPSLTRSMSPPLIQCL